MKEINTKLIASVALVSLLTAGSLFAQEDTSSSSEENIVLPEVTTTVSGDSLTAGKDSLPDFTKILPSHEDGVGLLPQLPGVTAVEIPEEPEAVLEAAPERAVYAQGLLGAGYPGYFIGDFSIYKSSGDDPFLLQFTHTQSNGYGQKLAGDGFFDTDTTMLGEKTFTIGAFSFATGASYNTFKYGLQRQSPVFSDMNFQDISLSEKITLTLPAGFTLGFDMPGHWYHRYAGVIKNDGSFTDLERDSTALILSPLFKVDWKYNAFAAGLFARYDFENNRAVSYYESLHRGQFGTSFMWQDFGFHAGADVSFVIGDKIGNNPYIVPFTADFGGEWKIGASMRPLTLCLKGGLMSNVSNKSLLERQKLFALQTELDSEVTDWFANFNISIPVLSSFTIDTAVSFVNSAFGNGDWVVNYSLAKATGLYQLVQTERSLLESNLAVAYTWKWCTFSLGWQAYWLTFVPEDQDPFALTFSFNIQDEDGVWGANLLVKEALGDGVDYVPEINVEGFYRFLSNFRLALQVQDAVKLFMGADRSYASSAYLSHAGGVNLLVRFFF